MTDSHPRGATPSGPAGPGGDRRIVDIIGQLREADPAIRSAFDFVADPHRMGQAFASRFENPVIPQIGLVVHALPHLNWYKLQLGGSGGATAACLLGQGSFLPLGVRDTAPIPPNSTVLYCRPPGVPFAVILGVLPERLGDGRMGSSDWIAQGGGSGMRREAADLQPLKAAARGGGVIDWSSGRPVDATPFDRGWMAETGVGLHVDPAMAFLRIDESCGLWMHLWDRHMRLAARSLLVESWAHEEHGQNDEGELRLVRGESLYPWEALGLYKSGPGLIDVAADKDVFYGVPRGKLDLPDQREDAVPFYRYREYGGYLGQGRQRLVALPPSSDGVRHLSDTNTDPGVFHEHIAIDGSYSLRSSKSVFIGKRAFVAVPVERNETTDASGDDSRAGGYRFSGVGTSGPPHLIGDVDCGNAEAKSLLRPAGILDLLSHTQNWKAGHPFHYHAKDFALPQPSASPGPVIAAEKLDFGVLATKNLLPDPTPTAVRVDDRYGKVNYYSRDSGISFLEDGGVVIEDGSGSRIVMAGGKIRIEAAGDLEFVAGRHILSLSKDLILRANGSVDISAAQHDVRVKAEGNVQVLAGNSGTGTLLLESKATGISQDYTDKFEEDVSGTGIVLKAATSAVSALAGEIYLRTGGGGGLNDGQITIDAGKGTGPLNLYAQATSLFTPGGLNVYATPGGDTAGVTATHHLGPNTVLLGTGVVVTGEVSIVDGGAGAGLTIDGAINASQSIACNGVVASQAGGLLVAVDTAFATQISRVASLLTSVASQFEDAGTQAFKDQLLSRYYTPKTAIGNTDNIAKIGFSFRDPPKAGSQYQTSDLKFLEPRWSQLVRLGAGSGGVSWVEPPVRNQGVDTYPWPGASAWNTDQSCLRLARLTMYDAAAGRDQDRPGPYEEAKLAGWDSVPLSQGLRIIY